MKYDQTKAITHIKIEFAELKRVKKKIPFLFVLMQLDTMDIKSHVVIEQYLNSCSGYRTLCSDWQNTKYVYQCLSMIQWNQQNLYWWWRWRWPNASNWNYCRWYSSRHNKWTILLFVFVQQYAMHDGWRYRNFYTKNKKRIEKWSRSINREGEREIDREKSIHFYITEVLSFCVIRLHLFFVWRKASAEMLFELFFFWAWNLVRFLLFSVIF